MKVESYDMVKIIYHCEKEHDEVWEKTVPEYKKRGYGISQSGGIKKSYAKYTMFNFVTLIKLKQTKQKSK